MALTAEVRAVPSDLASLYAASLDLQAFTGPVGPSRLHAMLERAGVDQCWLSGPRWAMLQELWDRQASVTEARTALARLVL